MDEIIERKISNLVQSQFPAFYNEEGPVFIQFVKAYYEWLEEEGNPLYYSRRFLEFRDIDDTIDDFLFYFQKKYLYGIPFDVIINKKLLLKHVLDVYRSKSSIQCYKLLFKLIYDEDMEVYLPGRDMLRVSDGTWKEDRYLEVSSSPLANDLVGKKVRGVSSGTTAIVESYVSEPINENVVGTLYLSNISPKGGQFDIGEKVIEDAVFEDGSANLAYYFINSPSVIGSLDYVEITNSGYNFKVGDLLKIAHRDPITNEITSTGVEGLVKVTELTTGRGQINFSIANAGFGYTTNNNTFLYRSLSDSTGTGASFRVGTITNIQEITYNTDLVTDYLSLTLNATSYNFPANSSGNIASNVGVLLTYTNGFFGSIGSLTQIRPGNGYTHNPDLFVRTSIISNSLGGTITYNSTSPTITGTGTSFTSLFANNDTIVIQANASLTNTREYHVIRQVTNATSITLYGNPTLNATASAKYRVAPNPLDANFLITEHDYIEADIDGFPYANSSSVISATKAINSGKGYVGGEPVSLYLYGCMDTPTIVEAGTGYANNEALLFAGGDPDIPAIGTITTNGNGSITETTLTFLGSGYKSKPRVYVKTANGTGASFDTTIKEFNTSIEVRGTVVKGGVGRGRGYWTTTRGFLNSDKYIQDSYYYQDFSYQIETAVTLSKYRDILYDTFHIAGTEMFGKFSLVVEDDMEMTIGEETNVALT